MLIIIKPIHVFILFFPAPLDYAPTQRTISSSFVEPAFVSIPISFDILEEQNETFTVRLVPALDQSMEGILISPNVATVTIVSKCVLGFR